MVRLRTKIGFSNEYRRSIDDNTKSGRISHSGRLWKVILIRFCFIDVALANVVTAMADNTAFICPEKCRCDSAITVNCSFAGITELSFVSLRFYYKMETIDLSHNGMRSIPELLSRYTEIVTLNLSSNLIGSVPQHAFSLMWKLRSLDLSDNRIENLSRDLHAGLIFAANVKLQYLNLSGNPLLRLGDGYDQDALYSESLLQLDVSRCDIRNVEGASALRALPKLERLDLSKNSRLARIDGLVSDSLDTLDVSDCDIQFMRTQSVDSLTKLTTLQISGNRHLSDQFDDSKPYSKSLIRLDVSHCSLLDANYGSQSGQIIRLIENDNRIRNVPAYAFANNTKLEWLDLSRNRIEFIDEFAFYGAVSLTWLDLSANAIFKLDGRDTFAFPSFLLVLNVSNNPIRLLPEKVIKSASLRVLDLSDCRIETLHQHCLLELPYLRIFNLSSNLLEYLPANLTSYSLETLDFTRCRLKTIDTSLFVHLPALVRLHLSGNRFVRLRRETFDAHNLELLTLDDNPWQCDCFDDNFRSLWRLYENSMNLHVAVVHLPVCQHPENVSGKTWPEACAEKWLPTRKTANDTIVVAVIVAVLLLCGSVACYVAFKEKYNQWERRREESRQCREYRAERRHERSDDGTDGGAPLSSPSTHIENAIDEMIQKLTQLPSYDEALLLPKTTSLASILTRNDRPSASVSGLTNVARKSSGIARIKNTSNEMPPLLQNDNDDDDDDDDKERIGSVTETVSTSFIRKKSLQEIDHIVEEPMMVISNELQQFCQSDDNGDDDNDDDGDNNDEQPEKFDSTIESTTSAALSPVPIRRKSLQEMVYINLPVNCAATDSKRDAELTENKVDNEREIFRLDSSAIDAEPIIALVSPFRRSSMQKMDYINETVKDTSIAPTYKSEPSNSSQRQHHESEYANITGSTEKDGVKNVPLTVQCTEL